jgi:hypothetical protein
MPRRSGEQAFALVEAQCAEPGVLAACPMLRRGQSGGETEEIVGKALEGCRRAASARRPQAKHSTGARL